MVHVWGNLSVLTSLLVQLLQGVKVYEFGTTLEENSRLVITNNVAAPEAFTLCIDFYTRLHKLRELLHTNYSGDLHIDIDFESEVIYLSIAGIWFLAIPESPPYIDLLTWETLCVSYDSNTQETIVAFRNTILVEENTSFPNRTLSRDFLNNLFIGERSRNFHFAGDITQVNIWSKVVDKEKLKNITNCASSNLQELPDILDWNDIDAKIEGGVIEKEFNEHPCKAESKQVQDILMPESPNSMFDAVKTCKLLQGNLSFPSNKDEIAPFIAKVKSRLPYSRCNTLVWSNYYQNSYAGDNWTIYESETTYWYPPFQHPGWMEWERGQPNGKHIQQCAAINMDGYLDDLKCTDKGFCFMCR